MNNLKKFEDYLPAGYSPHIIKTIPADVTREQALALGMDESTPANAVARALAGGDWKCKKCKNQTKLISYNQGFREYCNTECSNSSSDVKQKKQDISFKRYGTKYPTQAAEIILRIKESKKEILLRNEYIEPTFSRLEKFLNAEEIDFTSTKKYISLKDDKVRIYPLDSIREYALIDKVSLKYFQDISIDNEKNGIRTIWVKPWEFLPGTRKEAVMKSTILTSSGKIKYVFNGRDFEVRELEKGELRPFLETNSFYGYRAASINLGLYLKKDVGGFKKETLLMLYTFGHPFLGGKKKPYDLEVIRASTLLNCQVRGGASKLFKHFTTYYSLIKIGNRDLQWNTIVYYVDYDHNSGNSLPHLGFNFTGYSAPGFMNVEVATKNVFHRKPMQHAKIKQQIAAGEVYSVPNAGVKVFIYERKVAIGADSTFVGE